MRCITFGCGNRFEWDKFNPITNNTPWGNKPKGGLWCSPIDSDYGWKQWGEENEFGDFSTQFEFDLQGKILQIDSMEDMLNKLIWNSLDFQFLTIDFEKIVKEFDAVHLTVKGLAATRNARFEQSLYGWDCESIIVLNAKCLNI